MGNLGMQRELSEKKERIVREKRSPVILESLPDGLKGPSILIVHDEATKELLAYCLNKNATLHVNCQSESFMIMTYRPSFVKHHNFQRAVTKQHHYLF
ncbi:hypothetical protein Hanom_Chr03g00243231 [Helianthus anomalus]